jgi:hypothetical protein
MLDPERQKVLAALEQLESEKRAREDEKIAAGAARRVPLIAVVRAGGDPDKAIEEQKALQVAAARADGFTGEILFEEALTIHTGVPRHGITPPDWRPGPMSEKDPSHPAHRREAKAKAAAAPPAPAPKATPIEWKPVRVTASPPSERDMGLVIDAKYYIANGELVLDLAGRLYATPIAPGDQELAVARRLLRQKYGHNEFYGRINYPPPSIH